MSARILVVEDDPAWSKLACDILKKEGHSVEVCDDADGALTRLRSSPVDLLLLDVMLKGVSGIDLCRLLRQDPATAKIPILMLTAMKEVGDKVRGLDSGADDYLGKPFAAAELRARVAALLRRHGETAAAQGPLTSGEILLDVDRHEVRAGGKPVALSPKEFELLALLMQHKGRMVRKEFIIEAIWRRDALATSQTLAQHLKNLRAKLGPHAEAIKTVATLGYKFEEAPPRRRR